MPEPRSMSRRRNTVEVASSHLPLYSRPHTVAGLIKDAARSTTA
ncbi:hypothetical protein [Streptomyces inhibens]|nr:hypothetical protein [Streptomyces inhibens]